MELTETQAIARLDSLLARGFDRSELDDSEPAIYINVRCSQCQALVINGTATHEAGCPNAMQECKGCDTLIPARRYAKYCAECSQ